MFGSGEQTFSNLSIHDRAGYEGWMELHFIKSSKKISWKNTKILDRRPRGSESDDIAYVSAEGAADSVPEALAACKQWNFEPIEYGGFVFYKTSQKKWAVCTFDDKIEVTLFSNLTVDIGTPWHWERRSKAVIPLLEACGTHSLKGYTTTQEQAFLAAISAPERVLEIAVTMVGQSELYEKGKAAGRAELRRQILDLKP